MTCVFFLTPPTGLLRSRRGSDPGGISQPVALKFRVNSDGISVQIEGTNGRNCAFYAVSFVLIVTILALVGQVIPVQCDLRIVDVLRSQVNLVVYDVPQVFPAHLTHTAIYPDPFSDKACPA